MMTQGMVQVTEQRRTGGIPGREGWVHPARADAADGGAAPTWMALRPPTRQQLQRALTTPPNASKEEPPVARPGTDAFPAPSLRPPQNTRPRETLKQLEKTTFRSVFQNKPLDWSFSTTDIYGQLDI